MIKIFKAHPMRFTPFWEKEPIDFLKARGIEIIDDPAECDVIVSITFRTLIKHILKYGTKKKYLIWTVEPRDNTFFKPKIKGLLGIPDIHVMNIYTGDVWLNNYYENNYGTGAANCFLEPLSESNFSAFKNKKIAAIMIYRNDKRKWSLKRSNKELDLCYLRTKIALEGHKLNKVDIYGRDWPEGISLEVSRGGKWTIPKEPYTQKMMASPSLPQTYKDAGVLPEWSDRKGDILKNYHFNLSFENTKADYYCTEKIWDSIKYGCLPIYYGEQNKIYEDFPQDSFLDYCKFKKAKALFDYIDRMEVEEFRHRMNLCIQVFNQICEKRQYYKPYDGTILHEERLLKIVQKIKTIMNHPLE